MIKFLFGLLLICAPLGLIAIMIMEGGAFAVALYFMYIFAAIVTIILPILGAKLLKESMS